VFNLEKFMNYEFLRPTENRCKWLNCLGVTRKFVYIEKGGKCKISAKNNIVNWFTKCVNRFKQLNDKQDDHEDWYASHTFWIDSNVPRWRLIRFKILWIDSFDTIWRWEKPQEGGVELCFWKLLLIRSR